MSKRRRRARDELMDDDDDEGEVPAALTRKIISQAQEQQAEVEAEAAAEQRASAVSTALRRPRISEFDEDDEDDEAPSRAALDDDDDDDDAALAAAGGDGAYYEDVEEFEIGAEEARALELFMGGGQPRTLADIIMEKIAERTAAADGDEAAAVEAEGSMAGVPMPALPPKVIEVYRDVGKLLCHYRSGKLPRAFKIVPRLANWEEVLYVTDPGGWTPAATREATKIFASNLNSRMAQRFYNLVLLPAVQQDIRRNHKLNFHLYLALKKARAACQPRACCRRRRRRARARVDARAQSRDVSRPRTASRPQALYKPAAFFKGILLPLAEGRATLREALIVCSVLAKARHNYKKHRDADGPARAGIPQQQHEQRQRHRAGVDPDAPLGGRAAQARRDDAQARRQLALPPHAAPQEVRDTPEMSRRSR